MQTVKRQKSKYTRRQVQQADLARKIQNIIGRPGQRTMMDIATKHLLPNLPIDASDVAIAEDIYGSNLGSLKGKTPRRNNTHISTGISSVPPDILAAHRDVTLAIDIMFVNKIPFLITISRNIKFGTVERLINRQVSSIKRAIQTTIAQYHSRGFQVATILADPEFESLQGELPNIQLHCCGANEHVPEAERFIRTLKDRARSCYNMLPFTHIPSLILVYLIRNAVFWLNSFPYSDGVSSTLSPRYLVTGRQINFERHVRTEFGAYVQTHEEHNNAMTARTTGAICLGPTGSVHGTHYFLNLSTGARITRHRWTDLPMPQDVINRVSQLGQAQRMPPTLTFGDRHGLEIFDAPDDIDDAHDSDYQYNPESDDDSSVDTSTSSSSSSSSSSASSDDPDDPTSDASSVDSSIETPPRNTARPVLPIGAPAGVVEGEIAGVEPEIAGVEPEPNIPGMEHEIPGVEHQPSEDDDDDTNEVGEQGCQDDTGVADAAHEGDTEQVDCRHRVGQTQNPPDLIERQMEEKYGQREHDINLRPRRARDYSHLFSMYNMPLDDAHMTFLTEQMGIKKGLKAFGQDGAEAVVKEMHQLHYRKVIRPVKSSEMSKTQKRNSLRYLMFLKQKRCGKIKARGCADGRKQRVYKTKEETSAPTVHTESLFLSCVIDAHEHRNVVTCDIPGAFMQADMDEELHLRLDGPLAELIVRVDPELYSPYVTMERGQKVIYVILEKALYGTLQAAYLFWANLSKYLTEELGFTINPYDSCVANKTIDGSQCTVLWHVDDLKLSHKSQDVLDDLIDRLNQKYGQETPVTVQKGKVHEYLGMTIDFSIPGKVQFRMNDYVDRMLVEAPDDMTGSAVTPAAAHLFRVNTNSKRLDDDTAEVFHHLTAKLLYLCKRVRPDLMTAVAFLTTRVSQPDQDDYQKLARCIKYLRQFPHLPLTLEAHDDGKLEWWIDASFAVHPNMRSHTGGAMTLGRGSPISISTKQKINTKSSTEAEVVGVDDGMPMVLWSRNFLEHQGYAVQDNVVYQDNQSAILLERNGKSSSGRRTRHMDIRYFFATDQIAKGRMRVQYCPTEEMVADFFTKPLQGSLFRKFRALVLNLDDETRIDLSSSKSQECVGAEPILGDGDVSHNLMTHTSNRMVGKIDLATTPDAKRGMSKGQRG
ncbi:MAG: reverse transcriptase domain-containing protein [Halothiobacillus sp.]|nr:reverse transcriptase domain-containing protein [Halothiobacillus sp.]